MESEKYKYGSNKEIDKIILDTHNEFRKHSAMWGRKKEIEAICNRTGLNKRNVKQALCDMEHPYGKHYLTQRELEERKQKEENKIQRRKQFWDNFFDTTAKCPRCGSTSIAYDTKKLSIGRAIVGDAIAGAPGAVLGGLSSKKGYAVCLNCGKRWKI